MVNQMGPMMQASASVLVRGRRVFRCRLDVISIQPTRDRDVDSTTAIRPSFALWNFRRKGLALDR